MKRLPALLLLIVVAGPAPAQQPEPIKLALSPAAEPVPALKYVLLPELSEQTPGNAALLYYRAFSPEWWGVLCKREVMEKVDKASRAPIGELKNSDLKWLLNFQGLREVDRAARREYCDWELAQRVREQGIAMLVPELHGLREFGLVLAVRARLEMAQGQLDRSLYTLKTGLALARDIRSGPTLIQGLVGNAIALQMFAQLEELLRQPGAPNLYWALTDLPRPFVDLRKALQGEKMTLFATWPELRDVEDLRTWPQRQERLRIMGEYFVSDKMQLEGMLAPRIDEKLAAIAQVAKAYPAAKRALIASGRKAEEVEAMPALQVVLIESLRDYERRRDDLFKWSALPYPQALPALEEAERSLRKSAAPSEGIPLARVMLPALVKVAAVTARIDRRIAGLRAVEALRLYAAAHDGKWPARLADVKEVPIPLDPMTGKDFEYQVDGDKATLTAHAPGQEKATASNTLIYELRLRK